MGLLVGVGGRVSTIIRLLTRYGYYVTLGKLNGFNISYNGNLRLDSDHWIEFTRILLSEYRWTNDIISGTDSTLLTEQEGKLI